MGQWDTQKFSWVVQIEMGHKKIDPRTVPPLAPSPRGTVRDSYLHYMVFGVWVVEQHRRRRYEVCF